MNPSGLQYNRRYHLIVSSVTGKIRKPDYGWFLVTSNPNNHKKKRNEKKKNSFTEDPSLFLYLSFKEI